MAKKPKVSYTLSFLGTDLKFEDIKVAFVPEKEQQQKRFWIEFEGGRPRLITSQVFMLDLDDAEFVQATIVRPEEFELPHELHVADNGQYIFTMYNVIKGKPEDKQFYYIDEYYRGQLRLTHSAHFFPEGFEHTQIEGYELRKVIA